MNTIYEDTELCEHQVKEINNLLEATYAKLVDDIATQTKLANQDVVDYEEYYGDYDYYVCDLSLTDGENYVKLEVFLLDAENHMNPVAHRFYKYPMS